MTPEQFTESESALMYPLTVTKDTEDTDFRSALRTALLDFGVAELTAAQTDKLATHFALLQAWNRRVNLTRIIDPAKAARLHYAESLFASRFIADARNAIDIGSGAGFPAVPFAIVRPDLQVTALEANQKKCVFLKEVKDALGLDNFSGFRARIEEYDWSGFDLVTARALDRAGQIAPRIARSLGPHQRLLLFSTEKLVEVLRKDAGIVGGDSRTVRSGGGGVEIVDGESLVIETHHIPGSRERLAVLFRRKA
jgi:16S rRNA (guanine527-N7)-methyltransferase